jgi:DNA primase
MPDGEDPDTLAATGGKEAIRKVVGDALDVCERKIQLMERAGMLATVPGRRKTLDKLLPTLRATTEKVTRDLYVSLTAEALGTSREAVLGEVDRRARATHVPNVARKSGAVPASGAAGGFPERALIAVLIQEPAWRSRIAEQMEGKIIPGVERELIDALTALPANIQPGYLIQSLGPEAGILLRHLMSNRKADEQTIGMLVEDSVLAIEARVREDAIQQLDRKISLAAGDEKDAMLRDKKALVTKDPNNQSRKWKLN